MQTIYKTWHAEMRAVDARAAVVHGVAFAGFVAAQQIFEGIAMEKCLERSQPFKDFLKGHCTHAVAQVQQTVNVNAFWEDLLSVFRQGGFGVTRAELRRYFHAIGKEREHPPLADGRDQHGGYLQRPWTEWKIFIEPKGAIDVMRKHMAQQRRQMVLDQSDLQGQMSQRPYWDERNKPGVKQRFPDDGAPTHCWVINVDRFEDLGYTRVSDEAYLASKGTTPVSSGGTLAEMLNDDGWVDPRKGALFGLITALQKKKE